MPQYPTGNQAITVQAMLKRPVLIQRRMTDISKKGFIVDALLQSGYRADAGSVAYTRSESIYLDRDAEEVAPAAEYPIANPADPQQREEPARKFGLFTFLTEEAVRRSQLPEVDRALLKLRNSIIKFVDGQFLAKLLADVDVPTRVAAGAWLSSATTIGGDVENSRADIRLAMEGYEADTLLIHPSKVPAITDNDRFRQSFAGAKAVDNPIFTGQLPPLFGLDIMQTPFIAANTAIILQRKVIGGIADEVPLEAFPLPKEERRDVYWIKGRRIAATFLQEPKAAVKLTGI